MKTPHVLVLKFAQIQQEGAPGTKQAREYLHAKKCGRQERGRWTANGEFEIRSPEREEAQEGGDANEQRGGRSLPNAERERPTQQ